MALETFWQNVLTPTCTPTPLNVPLPFPTGAPLLLGNKEQWSSSLYFGLLGAMWVARRQLVFRKQ